MSERCPCGSGQGYADCCEPVIRGARKAATAEGLMRSRYSAYAKGEVAHIMASCVKDENIDEGATEEWSKKAEWKGLEIVKTERGRAADSEGVVEFIARYVMGGLNEEHHEVAKFIKKDGAWLYESGEVKTATVTRAAPKVGRNDPCPCGSGKKYKQCCGR